MTVTAALAASISGASLPPNAAAMGPKSRL